MIEQETKKTPEIKNKDLLFNALKIYIIHHSLKLPKYKSNPLKNTTEEL